MSIRNASFLMLIVFLFISSASCGKSERNAAPAAGHKISVVASLFPLYDFAKHVGKDKVDVEMLLPPSVEPHSFEPKPSDVVRLNKADIFIFTNKYMEPWVADIIKGMDNRNTLILDSSRGIDFIEEREEGHKDADQEHERGHAGMDPHIWLDFGNAVRMVDNICEGFTLKDPANAAYYRKNADEYKADLKALDARFRQGLGNCKNRVFINGGHFAFGYLAARYGLTYMSAYGFSPDAEPTPAQLVKISMMLKGHNLKYIFYEELISPRVAGMISRETGAQMLFLHGAHNVGKGEFNKGVTFVQLMEKNLENLEKGLSCH